MTRRERVIAAVRHEETDQVPWNLMWVPAIGDRLAEHFGTTHLHDAVGNHIYIVAGAARKPLYADPAEYGPTITDDFGVVWETTTRDRGHVLEYPLTEPTLRGSDFPDPDAPGRFDGLAEQVARHPDMFVAGLAGDLWERATFMRPLGELLVDLYDHPRFVHELLDRICDYDLATLARLMELPLDGVFISDDYGNQRQLAMSPGHWREFVRPRLARILDLAHSRGLVTMLHSCGCVREIVPDLIEIGLDVLHPIQPEALDVFDLKREYGRDLALWGGISTQHTLPRGTPEDVRAEVREKAWRLGEGGGYILEPGITIQEDVPIENVLALINEAREYQRG
ncbi:MAG TPA: uroporphyrinogen decarboxylase family protein [Armatimonadota bacterium]|nr:uroporphyrinogen decarboxylase family protein [Armatimonadota bacterium]